MGRTGRAEIRVVIRRIGLAAAVLLASASALSAQESTADLAKKLERVTKYLQGTRRVVIALRSSDAEFLIYPITNDNEAENARNPRLMRSVAHLLGTRYEDAWDRNPVAFYERLVEHFEAAARDLTAKLETRRNAGQSSRDRPAATEGPIAVPRDAQGRPIVTDSLISRFLKAEFSRTQTGSAPWRSGSFTQLDYDEVSKRIEWARRVKLSQGGPSLVSTPAMREQFSDDEVAVLNRRWRDLENAQNGRWNEVNW